MLLIIDNYDSFTYNLVQYFGELLPEFPEIADIVVKRNDEISLAEIRDLQPRAIAVSPGPGHPTQAGISMDVIREFGPQVPLLGVCLGHQSIGAVYGGTVHRAPTLMHGKTSEIYHQGVGVFAGLPNPFTATRYHSLAIARETCPAVLEVTAWTEDGLIMAVRHRDYPHLEGVQFHPESILTAAGKDLLRNFLQGAIAQLPS